MESGIAMPDFFQSGPVVTLPLLRRDAAEGLEQDLAKWANERPLALLLPCHVRDLENHSLTQIIGTLRGVSWISQIVVGLDGGTAAQRDAARERFGELPQRCDVLWSGHVAASGKGRTLQAAAAHLQRRPDIVAAVMHDCDIRNYSREFLARLCWPVLHPSAGFRACKGYYARSAGGLHGRLFRLLFQPLLRACRELFPAEKWPGFLRWFRYPLSGELCLESALLKDFCFDPGWGVEVRMLHGLYRTVAPERICQAELCETYDHKHQDADDLVKMAREVLRTLFETMREEGVPLSADDVDLLLKGFEREKDRALSESAVLARMNGMAYDAAGELALAEQFAGEVRQSLSGEWRPPEVAASGAAGPIDRARCD